MKKIIYITLFTVLGILLQFLIHVLVEKWYIGLLVNDFDGYNLGLSWSQWFTLHHISTVVLFIGGAIFGFWQGKFWWPRLYEKNKKV